jgi:hypothetical protein
MKSHAATLNVSLVDALLARAADRRAQVTANH